MTATARPRWVAQLVTWAATAIWAVGAYLVLVGVMFAVYARQGLQGSPPWWWVAVGAAAVTGVQRRRIRRRRLVPQPVRRAGCGLRRVPGTAAVVEVRAGHVSGWALLLPTNSYGSYMLDSGIFYPFQPDLMIARIILLAGIAVAATGLIGLPGRAGGPWLRRAAAIVTIAGLAAAGTAVRLADTAQLGPEGVVIPALHDAASDRPISYAPVCGRAAGIAVCLNPAYRDWLTISLPRCAPCSPRQPGCRERRPASPRSPRPIWASCHQPARP